MRAPWGLTLVEVLLAMVVLAVALLAWVQLEARAARAERAAEVRRELAGWMRGELRLQRVVRATECMARNAPPGWSCAVARSCVGGGAACDTETIRVTITPPAGAALAGTTAVWWPLERAAVASGP